MTVIHISTDISHSVLAVPQSSCSASRYGKHAGQKRGHDRSQVERYPTRTQPVRRRMQLLGHSYLDTVAWKHMLVNYMQARSQPNIVKWISCTIRIDMAGFMKMVFYHFFTPCFKSACINNLTYTLEWHYLINCFFKRVKLLVEEKL